MKRQWLYLLASASAAAVLGLSLAFGPGSKKATAADDDDKAASAIESKAAPDFTADTLVGPKVKLSDLKSNVVLIDFWATWCGPCRQSLPHVQELAHDQDLAKQGLKVVTVNIDDDKELVDPFMKKNKFDFTVALDPEGKVAEAYGARAIPMTVVVGRGGVVKKVFVGFEPDKSPKMLKDALTAALKDEAKGG